MQCNYNYNFPHLQEFYFLLLIALVKMQLSGEKQKKNENSSKKTKRPLGIMKAPNHCESLVSGSLNTPYRGLRNVWRRRDDWLICPQPQKLLVHRNCKNGCKLSQFTAVRLGILDQFHFASSVQIPSLLPQLLGEF